MATYVIGDIHGCFEEFQRLLDEIEFDASTDQLWHTGDLVNGGPSSRQTVRWFIDHEAVATTVLGNHDLHLIAVALGVQKKSHRDNFDDILEAEDSEELVDWLRHQSLLLVDRGYVLVHAGLLPEWTVLQAREAAREIEEILRSTSPEQVLGTMYGNRPARMSDVQTMEERWRMTVNALTRMRVLRRDGGLDFSFKSTYEEVPPTRVAWFDVSEARWDDHQAICGHWSALGFHLTDRVIALDTGCRWGGALTAIRLDDERVFRVKSKHEVDR